MGIFQSSLEGKYIKVNPMMALIYGYADPEEMLNEVDDINRQVHISMESRHRFTEILNKNGSVDKFEAMNLKKDGSVIWTSTSARAVKDEDGNILYYEGFVMDITKRKSIETNLFEAEERYRLLVESLPAVIFMDKFNNDQTTQYISPRILDLLGYTSEEWSRGDNLWDNSLHPEDRERILAEDKRTNETGEPFRVEYRMRHRKGHYVWIKEDASLIKGKDGLPRFWQGILLDITDQKQIEETLKRRDTILKAVGFSAEQFLKTTDWELIIDTVLAQLGEAAGLDHISIFRKEQETDSSMPASLVHEWKSEDLELSSRPPTPIKIDLHHEGFSRWVQFFNEGKTVFGNVIDLPPEEREHLQKQKILSTIGIPIQVGTDWWGFMRLDECSTERKWSDVEIEALRAAANTLGTSIERKISEEALRHSETSYRGLFNTVLDAIYIQDSEGRFLDVNEGAVQTYGYSKDYFLGKTPEFLSAPGKNDLDKLSHFVQLAYRGEPQQFEFWGLRKNGEIFPKDVRLFNGTYYGQKVVIAVAQDITLRKQSEEALKNQFRELSILHSVALMESTARDSDELIQQVTDIIGDALYSDNCGVLLLNESADILIPHSSYRGADIANIGVRFPITKGIAGEVVSTRRSIRAGDVSLEPSYFEVTSGTHSELCVPIISGSKIFGVLNAESKILNAFTERDERLLNTVAGGLANALERIQLFGAERKRRMEAETLREATLELTSNFELDKLFENIFASLAKLVNYDSASIEMINHGHIEIVAGKNIPQELIGHKYDTDLVRWNGPENSRKARIIDDVLLDSQFIKFEQTRYIRSWMGIPLLAKGSIIGFLNLDSRTPGFFNADHAAIAQTFANQAAVAIENTRLFNLEQSRRKEAEILSRATSSLANILNIDDLFENILDWLKVLAPYDSASILMKQQDNSLILAAKRNLPEQFQIGQTIPMSGEWMEIIQDLKPLVIEDAQRDPRFEKWGGTDYIHGWLSVAIYSQDSMLGFINLDSQIPGVYTKEHATLVQTFANQAAIAIEKVRLFELEKKRRESAETLMRAAADLTNLLDLPSLHKAILEWLHKIAPYDSASILEIEGDRVRITAAKGLPTPEKALDQTFSSSNTLCKIINETGQALIIDDCQLDPRFEKWGDAQHVHGWMGVPLISRGQVIGYLTVDSCTPGAFTQDDAVTAQTFAHQAATSLENTRLYIEAMQRLEELEMVNRVSFALRAAKDTEEMLPILLNEIKSSIETNTTAIWLYDPENDQLVPQAISGWLINLPTPTFKPNEGIIGRVFSTGLPHLSPELSRELTPSADDLSNYKDNWSGLTVPIRTSTDSIGIIMIARQKPLRIESHHIRLITTLADIAGNAIHRSSLFQKNAEQIRRLTTLREMDTSITSSLDLHITLDILTEHLTSKMDVSAARILVYNPNSQMLESFTAVGFNNPVSPRQPTSIGDGLASQILLNRRELYVKNIEDTPELFPAPLAAENFKSYYAIPLFSKGYTRGIIETYFRDPFTPTNDWKDFLKTLAGQATIAIDNAQLFENLQRSNQELSLAYDTTLEGWGKALELRDKETQGHTKRVTDLTVELARRLGISESDITLIRRGALLHDIGKMGVPDSILHKPGPLTSEEMTEMRKHPQYAFDLLSPIAYLRPTLDIAYCHHEWWDGNGYPRGLKGEEIPLSARVFAIVDVWDALLSDRPYRDAWPKDEVIKYISGLSGKQFDPRIVAKFQKLIETNSTIVKAYLPEKMQKTLRKKSAKETGSASRSKKKR
ncbi:MAG: GAF domain-containing protein [Anaerolineales bacterium]|nr:GAF domain-containing protein [Anaerolineales bacterium]